MYFHTGGRINTDRLNIDMFRRTFPISHFILLCPGSDLSRLVDPAVVLVTGDLTDAKSRDCSGSEQYQEEWQTYYDIVSTFTNQSALVWLDIRGNHDTFDVPHTAHR